MSMYQCRETALIQPESLRGVIAKRVTMRWPPLDVAVEDLDREGCVVDRDRLRGREPRRTRVAESRLPEADLAGRDVKIARQPRELVQAR
jgi:hypothetical protein